MKRFLICLSLLALILCLFAACGENEELPTDITTKDKVTTKKDTVETTAKPTYQVTFPGTSKAAMTVDKGYSLKKPSDPKKTGNIFGGWYLDADYTEKAEFPITINENTAIYAQFYTYETAFQSARNNTIGSEIPGYEYDYTITASAGYATYTLKGNTTGNSKYSNVGEVSFYDEHTNSGILFYDGTNYQIRRGDLLQKIALDENGILRKYSAEDVGASYRFDSSSFAKALFEYDESKLKSIEATDTPNEYKLNTAFNASKGIATVGNYLNSSIVKRLIGELPETSVDTGMYVTFSDGQIKTYRYEMTINVTSIQFSLIYELTFKNVGTAAAISTQTFSGLSLTADEIAQTKAEVNGYLTDFIGQEHSGYDYKVHTAVNFPSKNEIDATFQGSALRKTDGGTVYFHNDIEIDSDYKNADLYKSAGISDVHVKRSRLENGDVYLIEKKLLADKTTQITPYEANDTDSYYLFQAFAQIQDFTFIQKTVKGTNVTYSFGISASDVVKILNWLNGQLNLDPLGTATAEAKLFGTFDSSTVTPDEIEVTVTVKDGALDSISIVSDGTFRTAMTDSRDFTAVSEADYHFDYSLTVNEAGKTFEPYTSVKDAK